MDLFSGARVGKISDLFDLSVVTKPTNCCKH
jgi:hypothetical protein